MTDISGADAGPGLEKPEESLDPRLEAAARTLGLVTADPAAGGSSDGGSVGEGQPPTLDACQVAIGLCDEVLAETPDDPRSQLIKSYAFFMKGNGLLDQRRDIEAAAAYVAAEEADPTRAAPWRRRLVLKQCFVLDRLRHFSAVIDIGNDELARNPADEAMLLHVATAWHQMREFPQALAAYQRLLGVAKGKGRARALTNICGLYYIWPGHDHEALAAINEVLVMDPNDVAGLHNRKLVLQSLERSARQDG